MCNKFVIKIRFSYRYSIAELLSPKDKAASEIDANECSTGTKGSLSHLPPHTWPFRTANTKTNITQSSRNFAEPLDKDIESNSSESFLLTSPIYHLSYNTFECQICSEHFETANALNKHRFETHAEAFHCRHCPEIFYSLAGLTRHANKYQHQIENDCKMTLSD